MFGDSWLSSNYKHELPESRWVQGRCGHGGPPSPLAVLRSVFSTQCLQRRTVRFLAQGLGLAAGAGVGWSLPFCR